MDPAIVTRGEAAVSRVAPVPSVERIESVIALDLAKKAVIAAPVVVAGLGLWRGPDAALGAALALAIVVGNVLTSAAILGWGARRASHALAGIAMLSFLGRLVVITAVGAVVERAGVVDWPAFAVTLVASYLGLLFWELRSISLSLAYPGLEPKPGSHEE